MIILREVGGRSEGGLLGVMEYLADFEVGEEDELGMESRPCRITDSERGSSIRSPQEM